MLSFRSYCAAKSNILRRKTIYIADQNNLDCVAKSIKLHSKINSIAEQNKMNGRTKQDEWHLKRIHPAK
jgi:UDP-N-acetylmuramoylalanine-D-glutamate ligase